VAEKLAENIERDTGKTVRIHDYAVGELSAIRVLDALQIVFVSVYDAFNGIEHHEDPRAKGYIASDGMHTSEEGRQVIADLLRQVGYEPVDP
jgi:hypothetical protein